MQLVISLEKKMVVEDIDNPERKKSNNCRVLVAGIVEAGGNPGRKIGG